MQTKLSRICDAIIEAGWLAALIVAPLFFNTFSSRVFEPDKIHLVRSIALFIAAAWLVQLIDDAFGGGRRLTWRGVLRTSRSTPLVLPTLLLVVSYLVSNAISLVPRISFFGSYVRMQGTLTFLSYVVIFGAVLTHLRTRRQVNRILHAVIITSLPIAIYGIIQNAGLDPLPWGGDVQERVAGNMGNAIFIAAYLIMAFFLTLERMINSVASLLRTPDSGLGDALRAGAYLFVLVVQVTTIVFSQSRGPQLGLLAGLYVFTMLGLLLLARWGAARAAVPAFFRWISDHVRAAWLSLIGVAVAGILVLAVMNIPNGPLRGLCNVHYISRTCTLFNVNEGTNAVRALIWEGVVDLMTPGNALQLPDGPRDAWAVVRPLLGFGPESLWVAFNRFYPPELGHFESRNASPDRSHNETFDALARGGLVQLAAEVFLFGSVFYYALRWLGLMRGRRDRNLFLGFLIGGGLLGILLPLIMDGSLRLAGIGWPAGLMVGLILFVTVDLVFGGRVAAGAGEHVGDPRNQLLIVALFSAIVAHFLELHVGIAIVSTMTHFWTLAAVLVVVGMGWLREEEGAVAEQPLVAQPAHRVAPAAAPAPVAARPVSEATKRQPQPRRRDSDARGPKTQAPARRNDERGAPVRAPVRAFTPAPVATRPLLAVLPYAVIIALITAVFVWDYTIPQTSATDPFTIFWSAFTTRTSNFQTVASPMLLVLVLFTWLVGGMTALAEAREEGRNKFSTLSAALLYFGVAVAVFFIYGLIQAGRIETSGLDAMGVITTTVGHVVVFDVLLLLLALALAAGLALARPQPWPVRFARQTPVSLGAAALLLAAAVVLVSTLNIQTVQADTYYKQGQGYEGVGQWEGSVILYQKAAQLQPKEDYYYLFLGRSLLQLSDQMQPGTAVVPEDVTNVPTDQLLSLVDQAVRSGSRADMLAAAHAVLVGAQRLNPYNTDHSANLARLYRAWAFTGAVASGESGDPARLREVLLTTPDKVNQQQLQRSVAYYRNAVFLSPNNSGLWNELATVQYIQNDLAGAQATLQQSIAVDDRFYPTYSLLGDVLNAAGDKVGGLAAYKKAAEISPKNVSVLSELGLAGVEAGDPQTSADALLRIVDIEIAAIKSTQAQLGQLNAQVQAAGGYAALNSSAASQQDSLQRTLSQQQQQLFTAYRNLAVVYRSMGRTADALSYAQQALALASDADKAGLESLIAALKGQP